MASSKKVSKSSSSAQKPAAKAAMSTPKPILKNTAKATLNSAAKPAAPAIAKMTPKTIARSAAKSTAKKPAAKAATTNKDAETPSKVAKSPAKPREPKVVPVQPKPVPELGTTIGDRQARNMNLLGANESTLLFTLLEVGISWENVNWEKMVQHIEANAKKNKEGRDKLTAKKLQNATGKLMQKILSTRDFDAEGHHLGAVKVVNGEDAVVDQASGDIEGGVDSDEEPLATEAKRTTVKTVYVPIDHVPDFFKPKGDRRPAPRKKAVGPRKSPIPVEFAGMKKSAHPAVATKAIDRVHKLTGQVRVPLEESNDEDEGDGRMVEETMGPSEMDVDEEEDIYNA